MRFQGILLTLFPCVPKLHFLQRLWHKQLIRLALWQLVLIRFLFHFFRLLHLPLNIDIQNLRVQIHIYAFLSLAIMHSYLSSSILFLPSLCFHISSIWSFLLYTWFLLSILLLSVINFHSFSSISILFAPDLPKGFLVASNTLL